MTQGSTSGKFTRFKQLLDETLFRDVATGTVVQGDTIIGNATPAWARLVGDTSDARKFLRTLSVGGVAQIPGWDTLQAGDIPNLDAGKITTGTLGVARGGTGTGTAFTLGSIVFAGASGVYSQDNASLFYDATNKFLLPQDNVGQLGSTSRRWLNGIASNAWRIYVAASDANPTSSLESSILKFGAGGVSTLDVGFGRITASRELSSFPISTNDTSINIYATTDTGTNYARLVLESSVVSGIVINSSAGGAQGILPMIFQLGGLEVFRLVPTTKDIGITGGKLGVGLTNPATPLDVVGAIQSSTTIKAVTRLISPILSPITDAAAGISFNMADGTTNVMVIDTSNKWVGIGNPSPGAPLHVGGSAVTGDIRVDTPNSAQRAQLHFLKNGVLRWLINKNDATEAGANAGSNLEIINYDDSGNYLSFALTMLRSNGHLGIGTTSPNDVLDVVGNIVPHVTKTGGLGTATYRWGASYISANTTGTSRLVESGLTCPTCKLRMVRSTGETIYLGEDEDWTAAWCPVCGLTRHEKIEYPDDFDRTIPEPEKTEFLGTRIMVGSGNSYRVFADFKYSYAGKEYRNSTIMGRDEKKQFLTVSEDERKVMVKRWSETEWKATILAERMKEYAAGLERKYAEASSLVMGQL